MKKILVMTVMLVCMVGCTRQITNMAVIGKTYPAHKGPVQIFWENDWPKESDYEKIGYVSSKCVSFKCNWANVLSHMQEQASEYGANAILVKVAEKDAFILGQGQVGRNTSYVAGNALAIRLKGIEGSPTLPDVNVNKNTEEFSIFSDQFKKAFTPERRGDKPINKETIFHGVTDTGAQEGEQ